jgi:hypothetical protein
VATVVRAAVGVAVGAAAVAPVGARPVVVPVCGVEVARGVAAAVAPGIVVAGMGVTALTRSPALAASLLLT